MKSWWTSIDSVYNIGECVKLKSNNAENIYFTVVGFVVIWQILAIRVHFVSPTGFRGNLIVIGSCGDAFPFYFCFYSRHPCEAKMVQ